MPKPPLITGTLLCLLLCPGILLSEGPYRFETYTPPAGKQTIRHGDPGWMARMAHRRAKMNQKGATLQSAGVDEFHLPVLLGQFRDRKGTYKVKQIQDKLFANNPTGTVTDYYNEVSNGRFHLSGQVYNWVDVVNNADKYVASPTGTSADLGNFNQFVLEVVNASDQKVDFGQYDNDGPDGAPNSGDDDGFVDAVAVIYAGSWFMRGVDGLQSVLVLPDGKLYSTNDASANGGNVKILSIILVGESPLGPDSTKMAPIGVICHEFGHVLGLPDLYDYWGKSYGLGVWGLMAAEGPLLGGGERPVQMSAFCKSLLGWVETRTVTEPQTLRIDPVETSPVVYKLWEDGYGLSRYFLIENRRSGPGFDSLLPGSGLLIYHVDEQRWLGLGHSMGIAAGPFFENNDVAHKLVDLEEADGRRDLDDRQNGNSGDDGDPFPGSSGNSRFDDNSNPSSRDYTSGPTGVGISQLAETGGGAVQAQLAPRSMIGYFLCYDPGGISNNNYSSSSGILTGGVRFTAADSGALQALDFGTKYGNEKYEFRIYTSFKNSIPTGVVKKIIVGPPGPGWHTIDLGSPAPHVEAGQEFFVAFDSREPVFVDRSASYTDRSYYTFNGIGFHPLTELSGGNFNLRARIRTVPLATEAVSCDFNADGRVDIRDAVELLRFIREHPGDLRADFNRDGSAGVRDVLGMLLAHRNGSCP